MDLPAQGAASLAVDDFHRTETGGQGLIKETFDIGPGLAEGLADDVEFRRHPRRADGPIGRAGSSFLFSLFFFLQFVEIRCADVAEFDADRHAPQGYGKLLAAHVFDGTDAVQGVDEDLLPHF